jgi:hypothetical protein
MAASEAYRACVRLPESRENSAKPLGYTTLSRIQRNVLTSLTAVTLFTRRRFTKSERRKSETVRNVHAFELVLPCSSTQKQQHTDIATMRSFIQIVDSIFAFNEQSMMYNLSLNLCVTARWIFRNCCIYSTPGTRHGENHGYQKEVTQEGFEAQGR